MRLLLKKLRNNEMWQSLSELTFLTDIRFYMPEMKQTFCLLTEPLSLFWEEFCYLCNHMLRRAYILSCDLKILQEQKRIGVTMATHLSGNFCFYTRERQRFAENIWIFSCATQALWTNSAISSRKFLDFGAYRPQDCTMHFNIRSTVLWNVTTFQGTSCFNLLPRGWKHQDNPKYSYLPIRVHSITSKIRTRDGGRRFSLVKFYETTWRRIPEDRNCHIHVYRCENLRCHVLM